MALGFIDLEKAFDTVPREMVMATLRSMGVPEAEVRMVEGHEVEDAMKKLLYADDLALHGGEWQTGATGDAGGVERAIYLTRAEDKPRENGSVAHRPPEGRAGQRA